MMNNGFKDWERVIVALNDDEICGYCTVAITDCIPDVHYTPYIGYLFVDEKWRGNRLSQRLIIYSMSYLKSVGFDKVYLVSDHEIYMRNMDLTLLIGKCLLGVRKKRFIIKKYSSTSYILEL